MCSRKQEYLSIKYDAPIKAQIHINSLTTNYVNNQIDNALCQREISNKAINVFKKIRELIKANKSNWLEVLRTPFYINLLFDIDSFAYSSSTFDNIPNSKEAFQHYLINDFINNKLKNSKKDKHFLTWLAKWADKNNKVTFELADFQPNDVNSSTMIRIGAMTLGAIYGILSGGIIGYINGVTYNREEGAYEYFIENFTEGLLIGTIGGIFVGFLTTLIFSFSINEEDFRKVSLFKKEHSKVKSEISIKPYLKKALWMLITLTLFGFISDLIVYPPESVIDFIEENIFEVFEYYFEVALVFSYMFFIIEFFLDAKTSTLNFKMIKTPYFKLKSGFFFKLFFFLCVFISLMLYIIIGNYITDEDMQLDNPDFEHLPLFISIIGWFTFITLPLVKHFVLRLAFYLAGNIPLKYVTFLNKMTTYRILEKDGGQWRFRHKTIQDYFSNK